METTKKIEKNYLQILLSCYIMNSKMDCVFCNKEFDCENDCDREEMYDGWFIVYDHYFVDRKYMEKYSNSIYKICYKLFGDKIDGRICTECYETFLTKLEKTIKKMPKKDYCPYCKYLYYCSDMIDQICETCQVNPRLLK